MVINLRLPRVISGLVIGAGLSAAGASYQGMFRNRMVSPDVLGASAGVGFGAALARSFSREGYTVLTSIHEPDQALVFADRAVMISEGRVLADGGVDEVITEKLIADVYGVNVKISSSDSGGKGVLYNVIKD